MSAKRNPAYERWRWQIFSITWLAYAGFYLTRKAFSVAKNELKKKFTKLRPLFTRPTLHKNKWQVTAVLLHFFAC